MSFVTVTKRQLVTRGKWKEEIGEFTEPASGGEFQIATDVGPVLFFVPQALDSSDNDAALTYNSATTSGAQDDPGVMDVVGLSSGGKYMYRAIGGW